MVKRAQDELDAALKKYGADTPVEFPNTGYYLPISYGLLGMKITKLGELEPLLNKARALLLPPNKRWKFYGKEVPLPEKPWLPDENNHLPYLGMVLDAGVATLFADEIIEAIKYADPNTCPYLPNEEEPTEERLWLGAANDVIMRERGIEFVDGTAPGFAAVVGYCKDNETAVKIATALQERCIYVFIAAATDGKSFAYQLRDAGVQIGWPVRLVPFGDDVTAAIHALGFATRAALSFGGAKPGDYRRILRYNRLRIYAFVLAFGPVDDEKHAQAAGAINYGFPTLSEEDIDKITVTGICTYEHVVSPVPADEIVDKAIEVRGLKITISKVPVPVPYSPAFEGERIKREDMHVELGGPKAAGWELVQMRDMSEVQDGKVEVVGPDFDEMEVGSSNPIGILVEVAGRKFEKDFEPIVERRVHDFINQAQGLFHMGQRDIVWMRVSKAAFEAGIRAEHIGKIIHAKFHQEFGNVIDRVQVTVFTDKEEVEKRLEFARSVYKYRDERIEGMTDEEVDVFYSCTLCQSFAPTHVCVVTPEHPGLCGAFSWLDCKAAYEINPSGPNQPIKKGRCLDEKLGIWEGVNKFIYEKSNKTIEKMAAYSMIQFPMTSCGCFECIAAVLPSCNGWMVVDRDYAGETPCGMKFSTLAGMVGGGNQTPGFMGHSKRYIASRKYMRADGGLKRLCWMPKHLKEELRELLQKRCDEMGIPDFIDKIADETIATTEEEVLEFMQKVGHPALEMEPLF